MLRVTALDFIRSLT